MDEARRSVAAALTLARPSPRRPRLAPQGLTSRFRRDMLRRTWVPSGRLAEIEARTGVRIRFFVGRSQQRGDAVEADLAEEARQVGCGTVEGLL